MGWNKSETVRNEAGKLYEQLQQMGVDVILDDRDIRPGVMFADWELIGVPLRVTIGDRGLQEGVVEIQARRNGVTHKIALSDALARIKEQLDTL